MTKSREKLVSRYVDINHFRRNINGYNEYEGKYFICDGYEAMFIGEIPAGLKKADEPMSEDQIRKLVHNEYPLDPCMANSQYDHTVDIDDLQSFVKEHGGRRNQQHMPYYNVGGRKFDAIRLMDMIEIIVQPGKLFPRTCTVWWDPTSNMSPLWVWQLTEMSSVVRKGHDNIIAGMLMPCIDIIKK